MDKLLLLTGGTGLVGSNLLKSVPQGIDVIAPQGDLTDTEFIKSLPYADYIIHGAGYAQPVKFLSSPITTIKLNTSSLIELFGRLKPGGKLLFLSSSEVCSGAKPPYTETDIGTTTPEHKRACYIESKRCGETVCHILGGVIARLSLVYGPGVKKNDMRVMYDFIRQGLSGKIQLMDSGSAVRTYCYIDDAVEMLWDILLKGEGVYNVGGTSQLTIMELAQKIASIMGATVELGRGKDTAAPEAVRLDLSRVRDEFNKTRFTGIDEGLTKTISWYRRMYEK